jgi:hypothetical protein
MMGNCNRIPLQVATSLVQKIMMRHEMKMEWNAIKRMTLRAWQGNNMGMSSEFICKKRVSWEFHGDVIRTWEFHHANEKKKNMVLTFCVIHNHLVLKIIQHNREYMQELQLQELLRFWSSETH